MTRVLDHLRTTWVDICQFPQRQPALCCFILAVFAVYAIWMAGA